MKEERRSVPESFAAPFSYPRILGGYVAVNAVPDVWMLVDSADCSTLRAEIIQDNHDWNSTLITEDGRYRIASSGVCPNTIVLDRRYDLGEQIAVVGSGEGAFLFVCAAPVTALVGVDYRSIIAKVEERLAMKALVVDPVDSVGDWVSGYTQILEMLAENIELPGGTQRGEAVALVGYLWDRNEADHSASVEEMRRLIRGLGLDPVSVWLSGAPTTELARVSEASTIVALPYCGRAADILAARTGGSVVHLDLPIGLQGTIGWVEQLAAQTGRTAEGKKLVGREAPAHYELVAKAVLRHFMNRDFAICTEANLSVGLARMVREFGGVVKLLATAGASLPSSAHELAETIVENGTMEAIRRELASMSESGDSNPVLIGNERAIAVAESERIVVVPLGFQASGIHHLYDSPFLGFSGTLSLVDRIVNAIALEEIRRS